MYYYGLSFPVSDTGKAVAAMITESNNIRLEVVQYTEEGVEQTTDAILTKEEATKLMYHLQYIISLIPVTRP